MPPVLLLHLAPPISRLPKQAAIRQSEKRYIHPSSLQQSRERKKERRRRIYTIFKILQPASSYQRKEIGGGGERERERERGKKEREERKRERAREK
jgi:hypothetical protein